jgi:hypothetical protein
MGLQWPPHHGIVRQGLRRLIMQKARGWVFPAVLGAALLATPVHADTLNCAAPRLESEALLCQANVIRQRRVGTVVLGAAVGALLGNLVAKNSGGDRTAATVTGAMAGGLAGYWLSVQNEIEKTKASAAARKTEVKVRAAAEARRQKTSASHLSSELKVALLRSPSSANDPKKREAELAQIAKAANLGVQQAQDSGNGYTQVSQQMNTPVDARPMFAPTAASFKQTRDKACSQMQNPGSYCS